MPFKAKEPEEKTPKEPEITVKNIEDLDLEEFIEEIRPETEINEAKHETFLRIAKPRVQKILNNIRILGNCSNKSSYAYTHLEIIKMFDAISNALDKTKEKFLSQPVAKSKLFEF